MKPRRRNGVSGPDELLDLWMGEPDRSGAPKPEGPSWVVILGGVAGALVVSVVLAKYAVDVLLMVVALVALGLLLHFFGTWLAESNILSPGWFTIVVLGIALLGYAVLVPATSVAGLGRFVPAPIVRFFEWSESHGWGHRALIGPSEGTGTPPSPIGDGAAASARSSTSQPVSPTAGNVGSPGVTISASQATSVLGESVYFTARLNLSSDAAASAQSVRFRDGSAVLGAADVRREGQTRVATLMVRGLAEGRHEITAELVGSIGLSGAASDPVVHVVSAPRGR